MKIKIEASDEPITVLFDSEFEVVIVEQDTAISLLPQTILLGSAQEVKDLIAAITAVAKRNGWDV